MMVIASSENVNTLKASFRDSPVLASLPEYYSMCGNFEWITQRINPFPISEACDFMYKINVIKRD